jgi:hypothetical protein
MTPGIIEWKIVKAYTTPAWCGGILDFISYHPIEIIEDYPQLPLLHQDDQYIMQGFINARYHIHSPPFKTGMVMLLQPHRRPSISKTQKLMENIHLPQRCNPESTLQIFGPNMPNESIVSQLTSIYQPTHSPKE